ncbi:MAG: DedA family protein [Candidatus Riflebacteria bacterium]|nr:DedA family protein [Candidatus Riflebacteria bacterium]
METLTALVDLFLHLDKYLGEVIRSYGTLTYGILFLIVFCETGLVVTPLLPGDSLLFAVGTFSGMGHLDVRVVLVLLMLAAILGDAANYWIGHLVGPRVFRNDTSRFFKKEYLDRTHQFYERYGAKTIIIARFVPIIRTFAPFVAGIGAMTYWRFATYNVIGGVLWVSACVGAGYFFGNIPVVKQNFSLVILGIVFVSILPAVIEYLRERRRCQ